MIFIARSATISPPAFDEQFGPSAPTRRCGFTVKPFPGISMPRTDFPADSREHLPQVVGRERFGAECPGARARVRSSAAPGVSASLSQTWT